MLMSRYQTLLPGLLAALALSAPALAQTAAPAAAQTADEAKPFRLRDAIGAPAWLDVSGSVRLRYETLDNAFVAGRAGSDEMLATQTLLKVEAKGEQFAAGVELLDARRWVGNAGGASPAETDALEPIQLYAAWRPRHVFTDAGRLDLTLGRFTMDIGSRRLVARPVMRFLQQSFTGLRAVWSEADGPTVTAFYVAPVARLPSDAPSALDNEIALNTDADARFGGALFSLPLQGGLLAEAYAYDLDEDDSANAPSRNRDLATFGARLRRAPAAGRLDFELEAAAQTGMSRATASPADLIDLDHEAHMIHAEAGWSFAAPWSPRLALAYDEATGDRNPADGRNQRFDPLFGDRAFDLSPTGVYGAVARTNLRSPGIRLELKPDAMSDAYISLRRIDLDAPRDALANSNVRDASGASGRHAGDQLEGRWRRWIVKDSLRLIIAAAWMRRGGFLERAPNTTGEGDPLYGYAELGFSF
jgi:hypothetical protein